MTEKAFKPLKGHCTCKAVTYEVLAPFLCTHCCHCTWCQRETGSAFVLNSFIETSYFRITSETKPIKNDLPTASGNGQMMARCPKCYIPVYGDYGGDGTWTTVVRAGTLDDESRKTVRPDIHIFTSTKLDWVDLSGERERRVPISEGSYRSKDVWSKDSLERMAVLEKKMRRAEEARQTEGEPTKA